MLHKVWWSKRKPSVQATVFTSATLDRLNNLRAQCMSWG